MATRCVDGGHWFKSPLPICDCGALSIASPEMNPAAAPVGEPAAMPPEMPEIQVGDWVSDIEAPDVPYAVRTDEQAKRCSGDLRRFVSEIRKANGVIWRRTDRKEP